MAENTVDRAEGAERANQETIHTHREERRRPRPRRQQAEKRLPTRVRFLVNPPGEAVTTTWRWHNPSKAGRQRGGDFAPTANAPRRTDLPE